MRKTHISAGLFLTALSVWCLIWFIPNNTEPAQSELDISPALVPSIAIGTVLVMSIVMAWRAWRAGSAAADELDDEFGTEATGISGTVLLNTALWALASVVAWLLMEHVGFEPAMSAVLLATMLYIGVRGWLTIVLVTLLTPIVLAQTSYMFFDTVLPAFWR